MSLLLNALLNAFSRLRSLVVCYDKEVCCIWGGRLRVREGCVLGEYFVNEGKGEGKEEEVRSETDRDSCREKLSGESNREEKEVVR